MNQVTFEQLQKELTSLTQRPSEDCWSLNIGAQELIPLLKHLKDVLNYDMLMDICGVDWGLTSNPRFSVFYHLLSSTKHRYIRVACPCEDNDFPILPTTTSLWPAADWHERETYDMMGIEFKKHPDLRRILMWEDYPYHPLRKEFPLSGIDTDLPADDVAQATGASVKPAPMMGGPFASVGSCTMSKSEPFAKDESWSEAQAKPTQHLSKPS